MTAAFWLAQAGGIVTGELGFRCLVWQSHRHAAPAAVLTLQVVGKPTGLGATGSSTSAQHITAAARVVAGASQAVLGCGLVLRRSLVVLACRWGLGRTRRRRSA